jgi:hypothetical protein
MEPGSLWGLFRKQWVEMEQDMTGCLKWVAETRFEQYVGSGGADEAFRSACIRNSGLSENDLTPHVHIAEPVDEWNYECHLCGIDMGAYHP